MLYKVVFLWTFYPQRFVPPKRGLGYIHLCFPCQARMSVTLLMQTVLLDSKILDDHAYFAEGFTERLGGGGTSHTPLSLFSSPVACLGSAQVSGIFSSCSPTHPLRNPLSPAFVLGKSAVALRSHLTQQNKSLLVI